MVFGAQVCPALSSAPYRDVSVLNSDDKPSLLLVYSDWKPLLEKKGKQDWGAESLIGFDPNSSSNISGSMSISITRR